MVLLNYCTFAANFISLSKFRLSDMTIKQLVEAIDARILQGDIIGAFDNFAADNCVTLSGPDDITQSKAQKMEALRWFFNNVATVNQIEMKGYTVGKTTTDSQFVFHFTHQSGNPMVYDEVIRRTWKDGKLVEELYLLGQTLDVEPSASATPAKKAETAKKPTETKTATQETEVKTSAKSAAKSTPAATKADDLTLVEGIGPKIAELLKAAGIVSFADLAASKPAALKAILENAGKRYQMHDPATWPKQAALARDGKKAELEQLQAQLKGGVKS